MNMTEEKIFSNHTSLPMLPEGHSPGPPEGSGSVFSGAERQRPGVEEWGVGGGMLGKMNEPVYAPLPSTYTSCCLPSFLGFDKESLNNI